MSRSLLLAAATCLFAVSAEAGIEAVRGKRYELTKAHGPWMVHVASLQDRDSRGKVEGKSARDAADELIFELRQKGVPAYAFVMEKSTVRIDDQQQGAAVHTGGQIAVIAGNYKAIDTKNAEASLAWLKAYYPKCLSDGGVWKKTPGRPGPLSGAFLTVNPMLSQKELASHPNSSPEAGQIAQARQRILRQVNAGNPFPLYECHGRYSLCVARFVGKKTTDLDASGRPTEASTMAKVSRSLDNAGRDAWELCSVLRNDGVEAYLWHTRFESIVTVGSFDSPQDPRIRKYRQQYGLTYRKDAEGRTVPDYKYRIVDGFGKKKDESRRWLYLPEPTLEVVPSKP